MSNCVIISDYKWFKLDYKKIIRDGDYTCIRYTIVQNYKWFRRYTIWAIEIRGDL